MHHTTLLIRSTIVCSAVLLLSGCATTHSSEVIQFDPIPVAETGTLDLEPIAPRSVSELLNAAQHALATANKAQENGDTQRALGQYTLMLELLLESEIDPSIYYALRGEYEKVLNTSSLHARAYERDPSLTWSEELAVIAVRSDLDYPFPLPERVLSEVREIQDRYPEAFERGLSRSARYLPYIRAEFAKAGLPEDLVWLAMVESQFTPRIVSRAGAGGMWQFMRSTGRHYGLRIDGTIDERYDWKLSTQAAIKYLSNLHEMFDGEWPLAISAYNMGESGLSRAIAANGGERNLWSLLETPPAANRIRRETKKFYPKLLATAIVAKNPEKYGLKHEPLTPDNTVFAEVDGAYYLSDLEKAAGLPRDTLKRLNPHLVREMTPMDRKYRIAVPALAHDKVAAAIRTTPKARPDTHIVRRGETPSQIARMHGVSSRELMRINNIRSARHLQINQRLVIPGRASSARSERASNGRMVYTVRRGDSLSKIAGTHRVSVRNLQRWNGLGNGTRIRVGDRLYTSSGTGGSARPRLASNGYHTVRRGEYPEKIARAYGMKLDDLLQMNGLNRRSIIRVGEHLKISNSPAPNTHAVAKRSNSSHRTTAQPASTVRKLHTVAPGENGTIIASMYDVRLGDFLTWNGLGSRSVLQIGDEYVLYVTPATFKRMEAESNAATPKNGKKIIHRVTRGQNPVLIANRYHVRLRDLFVWNGWTKAPTLHVGSEVIVYQ